MAEAATLCGEGGGGRVLAATFWYLLSAETVSAGTYESAHSRLNSSPISPMRQPMARAASTTTSYLHEPRLITMRRWFFLRFLCRGSGGWGLGGQVWGRASA